MTTSKPGFSLMELIIYLAIAGVLMSLVWPTIKNALFKTKQFQATSTMNNIQQALHEYELDIGRFPTTREGIDVLIDQRNEPNWRGPYLRGMQAQPKDPWGQEFDYNSPPSEYKKKYRRFELISPGANPDDPRSAITVGE